MTLYFPWWWQKTETIQILHYVIGFVTKLYVHQTKMNVNLLH